MLYEVWLMGLAVGHVWMLSHERAVNERGALILQTVNWGTTQSIGMLSGGRVFRVVLVPENQEGGQNG